MLHSSGVRSGHAITRAVNLRRADHESVAQRMSYINSLAGSGGIDGLRSSEHQFFTLWSKACSILNNLTGRSRHSLRHCSVSADAIASQLVRNGTYEAVDRKSSRLVSQEVSDFWRATTPDPVNISDNFSLREFTAALQHFKPGKAPGPDSICSELIIHAGAALKSWLRDFLTSFCASCAESFGKPCQTCHPHF